MSKQDTQEYSFESGLEYYLLAAKEHADSAKASLKLQDGCLERALQLKRMIAGEGVSKEEFLESLNSEATDG